MTRLFWIKFVFLIRNVFLLHSQTYNYYITFISMSAYMFFFATSYLAMILYSLTIAILGLTVGTNSQNCYIIFLNCDYISLYISLISPNCNFISSYLLFNLEFDLFYNVTSFLQGGTDFHTVDMCRNWLVKNLHILRSIHWSKTCDS